MEVECGDGVFDEDLVTTNQVPEVSVGAVLARSRENSLDQLEDIFLFSSQDRPARYCPEFPGVKDRYIT